MTAGREDYDAAGYELDPGTTERRREGALDAAARRRLPQARPERVYPDDADFEAIAAERAEAREPAEDVW